MSPLFASESLENILPGRRTRRQLEDFLRRLAASGGATVPDGRPLYAWRLDEAGFRQLRGLLREAALHIPSPLQTGAPLTPAFCLFAAEWWRRNYRGGLWRWEPILAEAGLEDSPATSLYLAVKNGLHYWGRSVQTLDSPEQCRNLYLVTLACEGGLPMGLLRQEGNRLRHFFRTLMQDVRVFSGIDAEELARQDEHLLPLSLRNDVVHRLGASLVRTALEIASREHPDPEDPVADLDRRAPGWRNRLPLNLDDGPAAELLTGLIRQARQAPHPRIRMPQAVIRVREGAEEATLEAGMYLPPSLKEDTFTELMGGAWEESGCPNVLRLHLELPGGDHLPVARVSRRADGNWYFDSLLPESFRLPEEVLSLGAALVFSGERNDLARRELGGGVPLPESLPWHFTRREEADGLWRMQAVGAARFRDAEVLSLLPPGAELLDTSGEGTRPVGEIPIGNGFRTAWKWSGAVSVRLPNGLVCRASSRAETDDTAGFILEGELWGKRTGEVLWRGCPNVLEELGEGVVRGVAPEYLNWRPAGDGSTWRPGNPEGGGRLTLRVVRETGVCWQRNISLVSRDFRVDWVPMPNQVNQGAIILHGSGFQAGVTPSENLEAMGPLPQDGAQVFHLRAAGPCPEDVRLDLRWDTGGRLTLTLPFPRLEGYFTGRDGRRLARGGALHVDRLWGARACVIRPPKAGGFLEMEAELFAGGEDMPAVPIREAFPLEAVGEGRWEFDLGGAADAVRDMLALAEDQDAAVRLRLLGLSGPPAEVFVQRYDMELTCLHDEGRVVLTVKNDLVPPSSVTLRARPLWDPLAEPEDLAPIAPGEWAFPGPGRACGPWLLTGWEMSWSRVRPAKWDVGPRGGPASEAIGADSLEAVSRVPGRDNRLKAVDALLTGMGRDAGHPAWSTIARHLALFADLPPHASDVLQRLVHQPSTAALLLLSLARNEASPLVHRLEELPWALHTVCLDAWDAAARRMLDHLRTVCSHTPLDPVSLFLNLPLMKGDLDLGAGGDLVRDWVRFRVLDHPLDRLQYLRMALVPQAVAQLREGIAQARQSLFRRSVEAFPSPIAGLDTLRERWRAELKPERESVLEDPLHGPRIQVLVAPFLAACVFVHGGVIGPLEVRALKIARRFDPAWFDYAYGFYALKGVSERLGRDPGPAVE